MPVDKAGVGSAVLNAMRQVGGSLGIAAHGRDRRRAQYANGARSATSVRSTAFVDGFSTALVVASVIAFAGAVVAAVLVRHEVHEEPLRRLDGRACRRASAPGSRLQQSEEPAPAAAPGALVLGATRSPSTTTPEGLALRPSHALGPSSCRCRVPSFRSWRPAVARLGCT